MLQLEANKFLDHVRREGAKAVTWLNESSQGQAGFDQFPEIQLHQDLSELWQLFDGMTVPTGTLLQFGWLDGQFGYLSIAEAVEDYRISTDLWETDPDFKDYWPPAFVPLGTPGDGSRLLVNCAPESPTYGAVYELLHGVGLSRLSKNLTSYFATLNAGLSVGAIHVTPDGVIDVDLEAFNVVGASMNPGCDGFDDALPAAFETRDWLSEEGISTR